MSNVFIRLWTRLWGGFSKSVQTTEAEIADSKATEHQPEGIRELVEQGRAGMDLLEEYAREQEISQGHRKEHAEAFADVTRALANAATIIGPKGGNIKVILFADSSFILELLTKGQPEKLEEAFKQLPLEEREKIGKWIQY